MVNPTKPLETGDVTVSCQIYSGVPDPSWALSEAQIEQLIKLIGGLQQTTTLKPPAVAGRLDYRGFLVRAETRKMLAPEIVLLVHAGIIDRARLTLNVVDEGNKVERFLLKTAPSSQIDKTLRKRIEAAIHFVPPVMPKIGRRSRQKRRRMAASKSGKKAKAGHPCRPDYEPNKWNTPAHMGPNHCYDYATDTITDLGAQPGEGGGRVYTSATCDAISDAAELDGLKRVEDIIHPPVGHYVALCLQPGPVKDRDFHFYRRDCNGRWSHKVGKSPVTNLDSSDQLIDDPRICDRGSYTLFCGYFDCDPTMIKIGP